MALTAREKARLVVLAAKEKKGADIKILEVGQVTLIADYFVIINGLSKRQVQALTDFISEKMAEADIKPLHQAGYNEGLWVLLDYGDVVVHIFQPEERKFYNLERLWGHAPQVDNIN